MRRDLEVDLRDRPGVNGEARGGVKDGCGAAACAAAALAARTADASTSTSDDPATLFFSAQLGRLSNCMLSVNARRASSQSSLHLRPGGAAVPDEPVRRAGVRTTSEHTGPAAVARRVRIAPRARFARPRRLHRKIRRQRRRRHRAAAAADAARCDVRRRDGAAPVRAARISAAQGLPRRTQRRNRGGASGRPSRGGEDAGKRAGELRGGIAADAGAARLRADAIHPLCRAAGRRIARGRGRRARRAAAARRRRLFGRRLPAGRRRLAAARRAAADAVRAPRPRPSIEAMVRTLVARLELDLDRTLCVHWRGEDFFHPTSIHRHAAFATAQKVAERVAADAQRRASIACSSSRMRGSRRSRSCSAGCGVAASPPTRRGSSTAPPSAAPTDPSSPPSPRRRRARARAGFWARSARRSRSTLPRCARARSGRRSGWGAITAGQHRGRRPEGAGLGRGTRAGRSAGRVRSGRNSEIVCRACPASGDRRPPPPGPASRPAHRPLVRRDRTAHRGGAAAVADAGGARTLRVAPRHGLLHHGDRLPERHLDRRRILRLRGAARRPQEACRAEEASPPSARTATRTTGAAAAVAAAAARSRWPTVRSRS